MSGVEQVLARLVQFAPRPEGILDIVLVWFLVYEFLLLLKGSDTHHLRGLGFILAALGVAWLLTRPDRGLLQLETFNWLLSQVAPIGLIALVVVFQPEIRQTIAQLGQGSPFARQLTGSQQASLVHVINEIVEACVELSVRKIGALIAVERRQSLADVMETGKRVSGEVSSEILQTLFYPNTPLHDGAVVVQQDRIAAAACLLPPSDRRDLDSILGMRHRAALGLSERTDAVVVVVSEETGLISVAVGGELDRGLREEGLKGRLLEALQPAGSSLLSGAEGADGTAA